MSDIDESNLIRQLTRFVRNEDIKEELKEDIASTNSLQDEAVMLWCIVHGILEKRDVCRGDSKPCV